MKKLIATILFLHISANAEMIQMTLDKIPGAGEHNNLIEKICVDGYVFMNIYQKRPLMTIKYGNQTSLTAYPVLVSTTQVFTNVDGELRASQCFNGGKK